MSIRFEIKKGPLRALDKFFDEITRKTERILNEEIKNHLKLIKTTALQNKPWEDRTGTLRAGHVIRQMRDAQGRFTSGWELVADPYLNPQKGKRVTMDYAVWLEEHGWAWFYPTAEALEGELERNIKRRLGNIK